RPDREKLAAQQMRILAPLHRRKTGGRVGLKSNSCGHRFFETVAVRFRYQGVVKMLNSNLPSLELPAAVTDGASKNEPVIAKGGRASLSVPESVSPGTNMENGNHHPNGNGAEPMRIWKARNFIQAHANEELSL